MLIEASKLNDDLAPVEVYGVARSIGEMAAIDVPSFHFIEGSVADPDLPARLPDCDHYLYISGVSSDALKKVDQIIETQFIGLQSFLNKAAGSKSFVYVSSVRVYGRVSDASETPETAATVVTPMNLDNIYDAHKFFGESLCLWHWRNRQVRASAARITNVYGAHSALRSETAITDYVRQAYSSKTIKLLGHPDSCRNWICAPDVVQGLLLQLLRGEPAEAYNVGSAEHFSSFEVAERVAATLPFETTVQLPAGSPQVSLQRIAIDKAKQDLGYQPLFHFDELLPLIVERTAIGLGCKA